MKTILTFFLMMFISFSYSQELEDLINDGSGSTKIDYDSQFYKDSKKTGFELFSFSTSGCDERFGNEQIETKMIKHEFKNDTLTVTFGFSDACCISFLGDIEYKDNELNLKFSPLGEPCECRCYYTLEYKIKTKKNIKMIMFNGFEVKEKK